MNQESNPFISVVIPTYNRAAIIKKTIDSVLTQSYQNFEVMVVDDGSKDNTKEIIASIKDERIRFIEHPRNLGATAARNSGIKAARGKWIAFLDSDDIWDKTKLEKQVKIISELSDDYAVVHCGIQYVDFSTGNFISKRISRGDINEQVKKDLGIIPQTSTMIIRKNVLLEVGMFDENLPAMQEAELGLKIAQKYKFKLVDEILVFVTRNHNQIRGKPELYVKAKEMIIENHKNNLSRDILYGYCNIIAGDYIVNKNFLNAKKYLLAALNYRIKFKTVLSYIMLSIFPHLSNIIYKRRYKKKGLII